MSASAQRRGIPAITRPAASSRSRRATAARASRWSRSPARFESAIAESARIRRSDRVTGFMPLERRHARIPAAIALAAVAAFAVLWVGARTPFARGLIARAVSDAVGLPATVGALRLGFLPSLHLDIQGLAIAQPPGFGEEALFEAGRIAVTLP